MVASATNLSFSGLRDWIIQRVSALVIAAYVVFILAYIHFHPGLYFQDWHHLVKAPAMQIFTFLALFNILIHTWIGIWTVLTDYIKPPGLRLFLESVIALILISLLVWGVIIIWH